MKTDPRPVPISVIGQGAVTVTASYAGLTVSGPVEGGSVYRADSPLSPGDLLTAGDVLNFVPETPGGTVTLPCQKADEEFSGTYNDLDGKPDAQAGGNPHGSAFVPLLGGDRGMVLYDPPPADLKGGLWTAWEAGSATHVRAVVAAKGHVGNVKVALWRNDLTIDVGITQVGTVNLLTGVQEVVFTLSAPFSWSAGDTVGIGLSSTSATAWSLGVSDLGSLGGDLLHDVIWLNCGSNLYGNNEAGCYPTTGDPTWHPMITLGTAADASTTIRPEAFPVQEAAPLSGVAVVRPGYAEPVELRFGTGSSSYRTPLSPVPVGNLPEPRIFVAGTRYGRGETVRYGDRIYVALDAVSTDDTTAAAPDEDPARWARIVHTPPALVDQGGTPKLLYRMGSGSTAVLHEAAIWGPRFTAGATGDRPKYPRPGDQHFDLTLNRPVWLSADGVTWVDSSGTPV